MCGCVCVGTGVWSVCQLEAALVTTDETVLSGRHSKGRVGESVSRKGRFFGISCYVTCGLERRAAWTLWVRTSPHVPPLSLLTLVVVLICCARHCHVCMSCAFPIGCCLSVNMDADSSSTCCSGIAGRTVARNERECSGGFGYAWIRVAWSGVPC